jgi:FkbM family methyltransferase
MRGGTRLRLDLGDHMQLLAFLLRDYAPETTRYIDARLPANGTLFDVGGNVGLVSFMMATRRPDARIHAFEPNPVNVAAWRRNHALNRSSRVRLTAKGLSDGEREMRFRVPSDSGSGMLDAGGDQVVAVTTLDAYCSEHGVDHIDVLKLDVQGHEPAVLRGAARMLGEGRIDTVLCEIDESLLILAGEDSTAVVEPLAAHGFRACGVPEAGLRRLLPGAPRPSTEEDVAFELAC